jgi:hypothetical protein
MITRSWSARSLIQPLNHLIPVRGRTTRPEDRKQVSAHKLNVSWHIQDGRWIVYLPQLPPALGLVKIYAYTLLAACDLDPGQFLSRVTRRLAGVNRLRQCCGQPPQFGRTHAMACFSCEVRHLQVGRITPAAFQFRGRG